MTTAESVFDQIALTYDELWDGTAIGTSQRQAVWNEIEPLVCRGHRILDLGCGAGADALHLRSLGASTLGIDISAEMVRIARHRGVKALQLPFERLGELNEHFDGAISNFGALNCAKSLRTIAADLARLIVPGGHLAACVLGPCCVWEIAHFLLKGAPGKAFRRLGSDPTSWKGIEIRYPSMRQIQADFQPYFRLVRWCGIGLCVPPSYIKSTSEACIRKLARIDSLLCHLPILRGLSDHRLLVFQRV